MEYRLKIVLYKKHLPQIQNAFGLNGKIKAILIIVSIFIFFFSFFPFLKMVFIGILNVTWCLILTLYNYF